MKVRGVEPPYKIVIGEKPYFNPEDDSWFDWRGRIMPRARLAPGWREEWVVRYPIRYVGLVAIPQKIVVESYRDIAAATSNEYD